MKLSKKYLRSIKKKLLGCTLSIMASVMLISGSRLALFTAPISALANIKNGILTAFSSDEIATISNEPQKTSVELLEGNIVVCDSIVQGVRDADLPNGTYTFRVKGNINGTVEEKNYLVEFINYYDDVTYPTGSGTVSLGDTSTERKMLVVKYHKSLTIGSGVTVTANRNGNYTYKKGMFLCVMGELKNSGTITMTARGTYAQAGENVYLWKNTDDTFEYVPATGGGGAAGGSGQSGYNGKAGGTGGAGSKRSTGGGGGGAGQYSGYRGGAGSAGTSYSGGSGGGGGAGANGGAGGANGGAGGNAAAAKRGSENATGAGRRSRKSRWCSF